MQGHTGNVQAAHSVALAPAWPRVVAVDIVVDLVLLLWLAAQVSKGLSPQQLHFTISR